MGTVGGKGSKIANYVYECDGRIWRMDGGWVVE